MFPVTLTIAAGTRSVTHVVPVRLDGSLSLALDGPDGADYDVQVLDGRGIRYQTFDAGSDDRLTVRFFCRAVGSRAVRMRVRIVRRSGAGAYRLRVSWPG